MLWTVLALLVITIVLAVVGFSAAITAVKVLFWIFLALLVISFIASLVMPGGRRWTAP